MKIRSFLTLLVAVCFTFTEVKAQIPSVPSINRMISTTNISAGLDSMIDAANKAQFSRNLPYSSYATTVEAVGVKISGTASAKCVLLSTIDGTNYVPHFKSIDSTKAWLDTFAIKDVSGAQSHIFQIDPGTHRTGYELLWISGGGTQKIAVAGTMRYMQ